MNFQGQFTQGEIIEIIRGTLIPQVPQLKKTARYFKMGQSRDFGGTKGSDDKHDERKREFVRLKLNRKRSEQVFGKASRQNFERETFRLNINAAKHVNSCNRIYDKTEK